MAKQFEIGRTYSTRSICDYDTIFDVPDRQRREIHMSEDTGKPGRSSCAVIDDAGKATTRLIERLTDSATELKAAIVEARARLAKGRALWNGPCHECDAVLRAALAKCGDPLCPCQDGDACHYQDIAGSPALPAYNPLEDGPQLGEIFTSDEFRQSEHE